MIKQIVASLALVCAALTPALATPILPGGTVSPSVLSTAGLAPFSALISGTISPGTFTANYQTRVFSDTNNIYCSSCLDFVYFISNAGPNTIERTTMFNFGSVLTNVGYSSIGADSVLPVKVDRTVSGDVVAFSFDTTGLPVGGSSSFLIIQTDSTTFFDGSLSIQDESEGTGNAFAPVPGSTSPVPEPSSLLLFSSGLIGAAAMARRKFASKFNT